MQSSVQNIVYLLPFSFSGIVRTQTIPVTEIFHVISYFKRLILGYLGKIHATEPSAHGKCRVNFSPWNFLTVYGPRLNPRMSWIGGSLCKQG